MARRVTITKSWEIRSGTGKKGPWTLYGFDADDENGEAIAYELKGFSQLPVGPVEVEIERQEHEQYGVSFLLKPVQRQPAAAAGAEITQLVGRVARLESRVSRLEAGSPPADGPGLPHDDDDIPF